MRSIDWRKLLPRLECLLEADLSTYEQHQKTTSYGGQYLERLLENQKGSPLIGQELDVNQRNKDKNYD